MLKHLRISNFALIEQLSLEWKPCLTTVTGETGAGKSIMLGALNHLLGNRADLKALKDPTKKCVIEGVFQVESKFHKAIFKSLDLDYEVESIIRREILPSGKSRAFVNDSPVKLDTLHSLSVHLIDIHSQHDTILLKDADFQLDLIDSFGKHQKLLLQYQSTYQTWKKWEREIQRLEAESKAEGGDKDYLSFLLQELSEAQLVPGEEMELEEKLERLEYAGKIEEALGSFSSLADNEPTGLSAMLSQLKQEFSSVARFDQSLKLFSERIESLSIEFEDLRQEVEAYGSEGTFNASEKESLDQRLSLLVNLQKKHHVADSEALIIKRDAIEQQMFAAEDRQNDLEVATAKYADIHAELKELAGFLHLKRTELKPKLEAAILGLLKNLNLKDAEFQIELIQGERLGKLGCDTINFLFSANPGQSLQSLEKVASGGELSRVMLALKAILAKSRSLPTIIFDEIDTGVSGETAFKIGQILKEMGNYLQVISITHLAQIAAMGDQHYLVRKYTNAGNTISELVVLDDEARLKEIARLLGGDAISEAALANARELISK